LFQSNKTTLIEREVIKETISNNGDLVRFFRILDIFLLNLKLTGSKKLFINQFIKDSNMKLKAIVLLTSTLLSLDALADGMIGQQPTIAAPVIDYAPIGTIIPMLDMQFNCGECKPDLKIKALVEGVYLDQAELEKAAVNNAETVKYNVTSFRNRGKARFFIGALAGIDTISGTVACNYVYEQVSDSAISAINGW
jgi:hypothetical protein